MCLRPVISRGVAVFISDRYPERMSEIIGHETARRMLEQAAAHPAPGYLFHGPDGIGKRLIARDFASKLLATSEANLGTHPDYVALKREEGEQGIKVDAVRGFVARMHLTSAMGGRKVALIEDAEALNESGVNAFLKGVEEPDAHAVYLFLTDQPDRLPATLRSRLVSIALAPVPSEAIRDWLMSESIEPSLVERAVAAARGRPGIARRFLEDPDRWTRTESDARSLLTNMSLGELERRAKLLSASPDPATAWRSLISACERLLPEIVGNDPKAFIRIGRGLILARRFSGTSLSPHLGLEWTELEPYYDGDIPSFLHPTYL